VYRQFMATVSAMLSGQTLAGLTVEPFVLYANAIRLAPHACASHTSVETIHRVYRVKDNLRFSLSRRRGSLCHLLLDYKLPACDTSLHLVAKSLYIALESY